MEVNLSLLGLVEPQLLRKDKGLAFFTGREKVDWRMTSSPAILLIGASRGLGYALAEEFLKRGWCVVATVRTMQRSPLHDLADRYPDTLQIEQLDITQPSQIAAVRQRLSDRRFEMLFVNAGIADQNQSQTIGQVSTDEFVQVMITNALSPLRVIETLEDLVTSDGLIGVMSSGQGSVSNNRTGGHEVYRGSKAALNQYMRSYAARHAGDKRALILMAPGWVKTDLGGPEAKLTIEESIPRVVQVLLEKRDRPGLEYLDYQGQTVPW